jgi:hypothetical protein
MSSGYDVIVIGGGSLATCCLSSESRGRRRTYDDKQA